MESSQVPASPQQLRSWKEIASYLGVTPRTAQMWERKLGMPVHRLPGGPKAPVFAYPWELDQWVTRDRKPVPLTSRRWAVLLAMGCLLAVVAVPSFYRVREPVTAELKGKLLLVSDHRGEPVWSKTFPEADVSFYPPNQVRFGSEALMVGDIDSDGHNEVLFNYKPRQPEEPGKAKLICFDREGAVRWEFVYGRAKRWGTRNLTSLYFGSSLHLVRAPKDRTWVMTIANQMPFFPSQVAFLDPSDGIPEWEYWHPGHLNAALFVDLDGDRAAEILLSGINNPGPGIGHAALLALKSPAELQLPPPEQWQAADRWGGNEYLYVLFPNSRVADLIGGGSAASHLFLAETEGIGVGLAGGFEEQRHICWTGVYKLDFKLNALDFQPYDCFGSTIDWLIKEGKLSPGSKEAEFASLLRVLHFKTAPDGNSLEVAALWKQLRHNARRQQAEANSKSNAQLRHPGF